MSGGESAVDTHSWLKGQLPSATPERVSLFFNVPNIERGFGATREADGRVLKAGDC